MYPQAITDPIKEEFDGKKITQLVDSTEVSDFIEKKGTKLLFINSICGCAGSIARPIFIDLLEHPNAPVESATIFAGVDVEAINAFKEYLSSDLDYTSPAYYILRDENIVYKVLRNEIETSDAKVLNDYLGSLYEHYFKDTIDESVEIKDPKKQYMMTKQEANEVYKSKEYTFIDCRSKEERENDIIYEDSLLLTSQLVEEMFTSWDKDKKILFFCSMGIRSYDAVEYFLQNGFKNVKNLKEGLSASSN